MRPQEVRHLSRPTLGAAPPDRWSTGPSQGLSRSRAAGTAGKPGKLSFPPTPHAGFGGLSGRLSGFDGRAFGRKGKRSSGPFCGVAIGLASDEVHSAICWAMWTVGRRCCRFGSPGSEARRHAAAESRSVSRPAVVRRPPHGCATTTSPSPHHILDGNFVLPAYAAWRKRRLPVIPVFAAC